MREFPRRIVQTCKAFESIPKHWLETIEETKRLMPEWEYTLTDDTFNLNFVTVEYPWFLETYEKLPYPIMRADVFRYLWLHKYGGVYFDLDLCPARSLNDVVASLNEEKSVYLVSSGNSDTTITNSFMMSMPGDDFWLNVISEVVEAVNSSSSLPLYARLEMHAYILNVTGPLMLTRVFEKHPDSVDILDTYTINAYSSCDVKYWKEIREMNDYHFKAGSTFRPLPGSSWVGDREHAISEFYTCNHSEFVCVVIIVLVMFMLLVWFALRLSSEGCWVYSSSTSTSLNCPGWMWVDPSNTCTHPKIGDLTSH